RRSRLIIANTHYSLSILFSTNPNCTRGHLDTNPTCKRGLLEEFNPVLFMQCHNGFLPVREPAHAKTIAPLLADTQERPNLEDPHAKQLFDRVLDLRLGGPEIHLERIGVMMRELVRPFFRYQGLQQNLVRLQGRPSLLE